MTSLDEGDRATTTDIDGRAHGPATARGRRARGLLVGGGVVAVLGALVGAFFLGRATNDDPSSPASAVSVVEQAPLSPTDDLLEQALSFHTANDLEQATRLYEQVLATDPANKYAHFNLGQIAQTKGDLDVAIREYEAALASDPAYGPALYNAGLAYAEAGDRTSGIAMLRRALAVDPESAPTLFNLGTMLIADGSEEEGTELVARAVEIDPSLTPADG